MDPISLAPPARTDAEVEVQAAALDALPTALERAVAYHQAQSAARRAQGVYGERFAAAVAELAGEVGGQRRAAELLAGAGLRTVRGGEVTGATVWAAINRYAK